MALDLDHILNSPSVVYLQYDCTFLNTLGPELLTGWLETGEGSV